MMNKSPASTSLMPLFFSGLMIMATFSLAAQAQQTQAQPTPGSSPRPVPAAPQLGASSYLLIDFDSNTVLVESNADLQVEPASITKLMTSYVVFRELADGNISLGDQVPISEKAWRTGGSRMFVDPSMQVSLEDLLRGMVIQSGNDASVALAEYVAGSEEAFASLMNHYVELLGMTGTQFVNSTGLPDAGHYTTARDIARLSAAIIREFPEYYAWYSEKEFNFNGIRQHNRNTLLWRDPAIDGLKTGHTEAAGYCLAASAKRDGMRLISVVMGSASETSRASESQTLLNYGFRFFEAVQLYQAGQQLAEDQVWKGTASLVGLGIGEDLFVTIPRGRYDDLVARINVQPELSAPLSQGQQVGNISVHLDQEIIAERPLVTLQAIEEAGIFGRSWDGVKLWVNGFFEDDED